MHEALVRLPPTTKLLSPLVKCIWPAFYAHVYGSTLPCPTTTVIGTLDAWACGYALADKSDIVRLTCGVGATITGYHRATGYGIDAAVQY